MSIKKIVFVCNGHNPSSIRWAVGYLSESLKELGVETKIIDFGRGGNESDCDGADVVVFYRCVDIYNLHRAVRWRQEGKFVLCFLDDYIFQIDSKYGGNMTCWMASLRFMEEMEALISSSAVLLSKMPNKPKIWRRTVMGDEGLKLSEQRYRRGNIFSIGMLGGSGRQHWVDNAIKEYLKILGTMLKDDEQILFHYFGDENRFVSERNVKSVSHYYIPTENWVDWTIKLTELDLGVTVNFLEEDDEWCHCKSELKFVESSALSVPLITSRVPPFFDIIQEGVNGFFASKPEEFAEKTIKLLRDENLSRVVSANCRKYVEENNSRKNAIKFLGDLEEIRRVVK